MDWQLILALSLVLAAVAYLGWRSWRRHGCAGGCGGKKGSAEAAGIVALGTDRLQSKAQKSA